jgi:FkbM family methyltransferase
MERERIDELKKAYEDHEITLGDYSSQIFGEVEKLLAYPRILNDSVREILIDESGVAFKIQAKDWQKKAYHIYMEVFPKDYGSAPAIALCTGAYEPEELDMVSRLMSYMPEGTFLDIGANLGWYSLNVRKQYPSAQIYAFEAVPNIFKRLKKNLEWNKIEDIYCIDRGVFKENTTLPFYFDCVETSSSSMADLREHPETERVDCKVGRLDDLVQEYHIASVDFIKCDVEGSELFVYQGGQESIRQHKPVIFSEMLRKWSAKFGYHPNDIIDLLQGMGYECFVTDEDTTLKKFGRVTDDTVETNYFFLHTQKHQKIIEELVR